jgi:hypothetical protein
MNLPPDQGRAHGLYDEQLQRLQQEKRLAAGDRSALFGLGRTLPARDEAKTGAG